MTTEIVEKKVYPIALSDEEIGAIEKVEEVHQKYKLALAKGASSLVQAVATSKAIAVLDKAITPLMPHVMGLMNQPSGFLTDRPNYKDKSEYKEVEIRPIVIQALMKGLDWHGNKFNVISRRLYITKEGYYDLCLSLPDVSSPRCYALDVKLHREEDWAEVLMRAEYFFRGKAVSWDRPYRVKLNKGMDADGAIGKGKRRVFRDIYEEVSGIRDGDDLDDYSGGPRAIASSPQQKLAAVLESHSNGSASPPASMTVLAHIEDLLATLEMGEEAYLELCEGIGVKDPANATAAEAQRIVDALEKRLDSSQG